MRQLAACGLLLAAGTLAQASTIGSSYCAAANYTTGEHSTQSGDSCSASVTDAGAHVSITGRYGGGPVSPAGGLVEVVSFAHSPWGEYSDATAQADYTITDTVRFFGIDNAWLRFNGGHVSVPGMGYGYSTLNGSEWNSVLYSLSEAVTLTVRVRAQVGAISSYDAGSGVILNYSIAEILGRDASLELAPFTFASEGGFHYPLYNGVQIPWLDVYGTSAGVNAAVTLATPEPITAVLTLGGLAVTLLLRRRR
ncbi:MAG TPA: PEP-CTERM sorting domain-containing protein [Bryobacteraceae bacterium]|nr:PEP-CTERM sorting domain-containing protein [Bryobacteraceae bacterium]